ncbi:dehydrogenase/reductase SDR family member on chromosome X-like isoform X2 [Trichomycterus rosablanca]
MHVIIASHNKKIGLAAVKRLCVEKRGAQVEFEHLDLSSLSSVQEFVQRFRERRLPLHTLINNAAVMLVSEGKTEEGYERHFAINYLGHFLLTRLLLDILVHSGREEECSRVVNISSSAHYVSDSNLHDFQSLQNYSPHASYARSKLAQLLFTYHLHKELEQGSCAVTANAVDPGIVNTDLYRNLSFPAKLAQKLIACLLFRSPAKAAEIAVYAATSPDLESVSGCYIHEGNPVKSSLASYDAELQSELWKSTCKLLRLSTYIKT